MKSRCLICIYLIYLIISSISCLHTSNTMQEKLISPEHIMSLSSTNKFDDKIQIEITNAANPLDIMKAKQDLISLYFPNKQNSFRFSQTKYQSTTTTEESTSPSSMSPPQQTQNNPQSNEQNVKIISITSSSNYKEIKNDSIEIYNGDNIISNSLNNNNKFWCSSGAHKANDIIDLIITLETSTRLSSMYVQWAFAPGQFKVSYSNESPLVMNTLIDWRFSIKNTDAQWWKNAIGSAQTRWKYKSFDEKITFDIPIFAKYLKISMRMPFNQYYGIYKLSMFTKTNSLIMLKAISALSKEKNEDSNLCLSPLNGKETESTPIIAANCLNVIAFGDNRNIFELTSSGLLRTSSGSMCITIKSESLNRHDIVLSSCAKSESFGDDRAKWSLTYNGYLRSMKESDVCIGIDVDDSEGEVDPSDISAKSNSETNDGNHGANKALSVSENDYWSSDVLSAVAVFEAYFKNYAMTIGEINIDWKFPAKKFKLFALYSDGNWELIYKINNNDNALSTIQTKLNDYMGIKIVMNESTTKVNDKNVFAISHISFKTKTKKLKKFPCDAPSSSNLFEIIDINDTAISSAVNVNYRTSYSQLRSSKSKMIDVQTAYMKIPTLLIKSKEKSILLKKQLEAIDKKIYESQRNLQNFIADFQNDKSEKIKIFSIGTSDYYPAINCERIKKSFPSKRSGYYYIQSECMLKAQKVFCDFDDNHSTDILIRSIQNRKKKIRTLANLKDICYEIGMEPIEIKSGKMLHKIFNLIKIAGFDLFDDHVVPFAYDYSCEMGKCSHNYKSINSQASTSITENINDFIKFQNKKNFLLNSLYNNFSFDSSSNDFAFFSKNNAIYSSLSALSTKIAAVVCSTNKSGKKTYNFIDLNCDDNLRSEVFSNYERFSALKMLCPNRCELSTAKVYGTDIYTDNSSICKAAIHSGAIGTDGGYIEVDLLPGEDSYFGGERNGVSSLDFSSKWDKSFKVRKYKPMCESDNISNENEEEDETQNTSFIEIQSIDDSNNKLEVYKGKLELIKKMKEMINNKNKTVLSSIIKRLKDEVEKGIEMLMKFKQSSNNTNLYSNNNYYSQIKDEKQKLIYSQIQNEIQQANNISANAIASMIGIPQIIKNKPSTQTYLNFFYNNFKQELFSLNEIKSFSDNLKTFIGETISRIDNLRSDINLGVDVQKKKFTIIENKMMSLYKILFEIDKKIQNKLKSTEYQIKEKKAKYTSYKIRDTFIENYLNGDIDTNWEIFNSKKGKGEIAKWTYFNYNINGHLKVIKQTGNFVDNRSGSHLILRNHRYYDFELSFSVLIKDDSAFGAAFRYVDSFNYYIFEVSNKDGGFKRVRRFSKGVPKIIDIKNDGGFVQDTWYSVKIRGVQNNIEIYMSETNDNNNYSDHSDLDLQFKIVDNYFVRGTIAFASQGINYLLLDNISVIPLQCTVSSANAFSSSENEGDNKFGTLTPTCSRFKETFKNGFWDRWKKIDPIKCDNCPSQWDMKLNRDGRDAVLTQNVLVRAESTDQEGTMFILKNESKVCSKGKFSISVKPKDENGVIGVIFRYNSGNYYILEISNEKNKFVRIRKKIIDKFLLVGISSDYGYQPGKWMKIILTLNGGVFNVFITQDENLETPIKVFKNNIIDNDLVYGVVGLGTYNTRALFADIELSAFEDDLLYVNEDEINPKFLPSSSSRDQSKKMTNFDRANRNIKNFSWRQCLNNPFENSRKKFCDVLFVAKTDIANCQSNFCKTCCEKLVDATNPAHKYLCNKQCNNYTGGILNENSWKSCIEPENPERSIYTYCESGYGGDFYAEKKCKVDMCNTCCVTFDTKKGNFRMSDDGLRKCYEKCSDTFMKIKQSN